MKLGNTEIKGKAVLAPMAGVTDRAFRELCMGFGAAYCTSEMVSAKGLIMSDRNRGGAFSRRHRYQHGLPRAENRRQSQRERADEGSGAVRQDSGSGC